jgi:hypothetical protein
LVVNTSVVLTNPVIWQKAAHIMRI